MAEGHLKAMSEGAEAAVKVHEFDVRDVPISRVVVYNDQAEVTRLLSVKLAAGVNEVHVKNLSIMTVPDSLRVTGRGSARIHEITEKQEPKLKKEVDSAKVATLRSVREQLKSDGKRVMDKIFVLKKQSDALDELISQMGTGVFKPPVDGGTATLNSGTIDGIKSLLVFYNSQALILREELRKGDHALQEIEEKFKKAENELNEASNFNKITPFSMRTVITLECTEDGDAELDVVYLVHDAKWQASYDIRVTTGEHPKLQIAYFGKVCNLTMEDWQSANLTLSTARPSSSGKIPELGTVEVCFASQAPSQGTFQCNQLGTQFQTGSLFGCASTLGPQQMPMAHVMASEVIENVLCTDFKIEKAATIPHGSTQHKVTIGVVDLVPQLVHECVPSKYAAAFLTAFAVNSSKLSFLTGAASVYLNNAFVAKSEMKNVSPGEPFKCSLGVDDAIRVHYNPPKKFKEHHNVFLGDSLKEVTEQVIVIKNAHIGQPTLLTLYHNIPLSTDEKIKVRLLQPEETKTTNDTGSTKEGVRINKKNNLVWTLIFEPGESKDLLIKWDVDHPKDEPVRFIEKQRKIF